MIIINIIIALGLIILINKFVDIIGRAFVRVQLQFGNMKWFDVS